MDHSLEGRIGLVGAHCDALELLEFHEEVFDQMAAFVDLQVDNEGRYALRALRDADHCPARVHVRDDPIAVESLVGQHRVKADPCDERGHADRVEAMSRQQFEADEVAQRVGQRQDPGRPATLRFAYRLTLCPPFEPCPWR